MLKVVETFSGIGAQAKALKNINVEHEILATADWDINAIIAYDLIHNGNYTFRKEPRQSREDFLNKLKSKTLSLDGKKSITEKQLNKLSINVLERLCNAIERSNNLISVTDIKGRELPEKFDLLTYSFPCQDLSTAGFWHGNKGGIDRNANNRSSMLWQIERILLERFKGKLEMPKFLLMENVVNITAERNKENLNEWVKSLNRMGYTSYPMILNAKDFGLPQKRRRFYMLSILTKNDKALIKNIDKYFENNDLQNEEYLEKLQIKMIKLNKILKTDYTIKEYLNEALESQPNDTTSRRQIYDENLKIFKNNKIQIDILPTLTTKQDRNPNSGVIEFDSQISNKSSFRYITPREGFMLMGFSEKDYNNIIRNNFIGTKTNLFFTRDKLNKMAGNSIAVPVLEQIFKQVIEIKEKFLDI